MIMSVPAKNKKELSLTALKMAAATLKEGLAHPPANDLERDGVIQRFEYTFELAWKTLKRYLELNYSIEGFNIKDILREAGKLGLIENVEEWFTYLEARNLSSHTYDKPTAEKAYGRAVLFEKDVNALIEKISKKLG